MSNQKDTIRNAPENASYGYSVIPRSYAQSGNLSLEALGLWTYLMSRPPDWELHVNDIRRRFNVGRDKAYRIIHELRDAGHLIGRTKKRNDKGQWVNDPYIFYELPKFPPLTENQYTGANPPETPENPPLPENTDSENQNSVFQETNIIKNIHCESQKFDSPENLADANLSGEDEVEPDVLPVPIEETNGKKKKPKYTGGVDMDKQLLAMSKLNGGGIGSSGNNQEGFHYDDDDEVSPTKRSKTRKVKALTACEQAILEVLREHGNNKKVKGYTAQQRSRITGIIQNINSDTNAIDKAYDANPEVFIEWITEMTQERLSYISSSGFKKTVSRDAIIDMIGSRFRDFLSMIGEQKTQFEENNEWRWNEVKDIRGDDTDPNWLMSRLLQVHRYAYGDKYAYSELYNRGVAYFYEKYPDNPNKLPMPYPEKKVTKHD